MISIFGVYCLHFYSNGNSVIKQKKFLVKKIKTIANIWLYVTQSILINDERCCRYIPDFFSFASGFAVHQCILKRRITRKLFQSSLLLNHCNSAELLKVRIKI